MGNVDPNTARLCNSVLNRNKLHRKGVDSTASQRQDLAVGIGVLANTRKNAAPPCGAADWSSTNLALASTATQVDFTATARVGTVFLPILSTPFVDITVSSKVFRPQQKIE